MKQLPLPISLSPRATFNNFIAGLNLQAVTSLRELPASPSEIQVLIWGDGARGKTHLLQAVCHLLADTDKNAVYIPLKQLHDSDPRLLHGLEQLDMVCIDDIQLVTGEQEWSLELFNLINRCRETRTPLVMSSSQRPQELEFSLPDLSSRLLWGPVFHLKLLKDADLLETISQRARQLGIVIPHEAASYLLKHCRRDIGALLKIVDQLDQETLIQKRKVTLPLVRSVIESDH